MDSPPPTKKPKKHQDCENQKEDKKKKKKSAKGKAGGTLTLDELKLLGHQLLSSRAHINNLPILLSLLSSSSSSSSSPELALESFLSLQSFFVPLIPEIPSASSPTAAGERKRKSAGSGGAAEEKDAESVFKVWIRERFHEFVNKLIDISVAAESDDALKDVALDAIMDFVKMGKGGKFQSAIYYKLIRRIVHATSAIDTLLDMLAMKYFNYVDVRYFTYISLSKVLSNFEQSIAVSNKATSHNDGDLPKAEIQHAIHTIYKLLSSLPPPTTNKEQDFEMWSESGLATKDAGKVAPTDTTNGSSVILNKKFYSANQITKKLKSRFTRAWISFLKLPLPVDVYKEILASIHQNVIPYMANPSILCDFLTRSYDIGGVISVMALSGLFILMTEHGLEYPKFYEKLYALLTPTVFLAKHRAVFFQLLDSCLKSSYLSAHLAAAFTKKLSRLALSVPPSGELIIIALIHNLLRRHPSINFLVHQAAEDEDNRESSLEDSKSMAADIGGVDLSEKAGIDPFKIEENDPLKSNAMRSSLWEIETLRHHYSPAVSRFVASLENDLTVRAKTSEVAISDFSSGSYATVFRDEIRRRIKQVPLAFYRSTPSSLFCSSDFAGWSFGDQQSDQPEES